MDPVSNFFLALELKLTHFFMQKIWLELATVQEKQIFCKTYLR